MLASLVGLQSRIDRGDYFGVKTASKAITLPLGSVALDEPSVFTVS
jgi:hypothetical protein